jgi:hypothetical protein
MRRDDADRLLVVAGIAWLWFGGAVAAASAAFDVEPAGAIAMSVSVPVLSAIAAVTMWRHVAGARPWLVVGAVVGLVATLVLGGSPLFTLATVPGYVAIAAGAARMRIPPERVDSAPPQPSTAARDDQDLAAFLDRAGHLDREATRVLAAAWRAGDANARRAAWGEVTRAAKRTGRAAQLDDVRREIELWGRAAGGSPWTWEWATMTDIDRSDIRRSAMPALLDAAAAILLGAQLSGPARDTLLAPWEAALGTPVEAEDGEGRIAPMDAPSAS